MDQEEIAKTIVEIEKEFDVNSLIYKNFKAWPLLRMFIANRLNTTRVSSSALSKSKASPVPVVGNHNFFYILFLIILYKIKYYLEVFSLKKNKNIDILFLSRPEHYTDNIEEQSYNRHIDPFISLIKGKYRFVKFEIFTKNSKDIKQRYYSTKVVNPEYSFKINALKKRLFSFIGFKKKEAPIQAFNKLQKILSEKAVDVKLKEKTILSFINVVEQYQFFFEGILTKYVRPKAVFSPANYNLISMGLILACKKLNIKFVDIQHGKQGRYAIPYTLWTRLPPEGYELLPDFYWTWGYDSLENIAKHKSKDYEMHKPIIGGNLWTANWKADRIVVGKEFDSFLNTFHDYNKIILVSLQPIKNPVPEFVFETIETANPSWLWLFRMHPLNKNVKEELEREFIKRKIVNYEIDYATMCPLYAILKVTDHHLTCWSSVGIEALSFDVPTTIIHPEGLRVFSKEIKNRIFLYAENSKDLCSQIESKNDYKPTNGSAQYIETDLKVAMDALNLIMGS